MCMCKNWEMQKEKYTHYKSDKMIFLKWYNSAGFWMQLNHCLDEMYSFFYIRKTERLKINGILYLYLYKYLHLLSKLKRIHCKKRKMIDQYLSLKVMQNFKENTSKWNTKIYKIMHHDQTVYLWNARVVYHS